MTTAPKATPAEITLPGLDCGVCGFRTCAELAQHLATQPALLERCIHRAPAAMTTVPATSPGCGGAAVCPAQEPPGGQPLPTFSDPQQQSPWQDTLGREFDFYLEHFPEEPGPREIILPHNPLITRELAVRVGDVLIGRPLGMSCGCPITHCGVAMNVDPRTGVITWCVTGPLRPRQDGFKDLGYYSAEAYEGLVRQQRPGVDLRIGTRYFFQPRLCMLQWRHSGLLNFINRTPEGVQVRLEGLWIG